MHLCQFWHTIEGDSRKQIRAFPEQVKDDMGHALDVAQLGGKHESAKPLGGFGGGSVLEVVEQFDSNAYRAVYTVKLRGAVYVLHAFQKKSTSGIKTSKADIDLVKHRLKEAARMHAERRGTMATKIEASSGNVFADLGVADAEEMQVKSELTYRIATLIAEKKLSRAKAAELLGIDPPKVSKLVRGSALREFSYERLMRYLTLLGQDVELVMKSRKRGAGRVQVVHG